MAEQTMALGPIEHGTRSSFTYYGCSRNGTSDRGSNPSAYWRMKAKIRRVAVTRGVSRCLFLPLLAPALSLSLQAQSVRFNFQPLLKSASATQPSSEPLDVPCPQGDLQSSRRAVEPYSALNYSLSVDNGLHDDPEDRSVSCAPGQAPSTLFPAPTGASAPGSAVGRNDEEGRQVSWGTVFPNFFSDQERIWTFPFRLDQHWKPTLAVVGITAGLIALDPHDTPYFRRTNNFGLLPKVFKVTTTERVFLGLPVAEYLFGLVRHKRL